MKWTLKRKTICIPIVRSTPVAPPYRIVESVGTPSLEFLTDQSVSVVVAIARVANEQTAMRHGRESENDASTKKLLDDR